MSKTTSTRGFWALFATQFQGAFNDNLFQYLVIYFLVALATVGIDDAALTEVETGRVSAWATMLFSLPFMVFPGLFGALSDRYSKKRITVWSKYLEVAVMALGAVAFFLGTRSALWVLLFLMATQSAFFSPSKYGILPEILPESRLSWGNGVIALGTMIAILAGVGVAGPIFDGLGSRTYLAGVGLAVLSGFGVLASYGITRPPAANPSRAIPWNPWADMGRYLRIIRADRFLLVATAGVVFFWFAGALLRANIISFGKVALELSNTQISVMQVCLALGIGVGSLVAGYLSKGKIELGLVPLGLLGLAVCNVLLFREWGPFAMDLSAYHIAFAFTLSGYAIVLTLLACMGFFAGMFNVPLQAMVQYRSPAKAKGGLMATVNMLTFLGMFVAGGLFWALSAAGVTTRHVFLATGAFAVAVGVYMTARLPFILVRFIVWLLANTFYRLEVIGREHVPLEGSALLVGNHTAYLDPGVVVAALDRPVRFLGYRPYVDSWWLNWLARIMNVIPVASTDPRGALAESLSNANEAMKNGELVSLFPEGCITRTGQLQSFQKGYQRVMRNVDAPIVPFHIDNLWGSMFSFAGGRFFGKWPKEFPHRVTIAFGEPLPPDAQPHELRNAVQALSADNGMRRRYKPALLHRRFIKAARRHPRLWGVADARTGALSYFKTLVGSVVLARKLKRLLGTQAMVGVLLPPTVGAALTNVSLQIMNRIPVNLNYTTSDATIENMARRCEMTHCITAKAFLERLPLKVPGKAVYLEDIMASVTKMDRVVGMLVGVLCPARLLEWLCGSRGRRSDGDLCTVIFSSGSEGEPKGVMLTHRGIVSNMDASATIYPHVPGDALMGFLPFFHSFGFAATLWAPLMEGATGVYHPNPLEPRAIGKLVRKYRARYLTATPTFLQSFIRRCPAEDLETLEFLVVGAEKFPDRVRDAYIEKFGVEPREGYGATEAGPAISMNIPDFREPGFQLPGTRRGTVGRPIPGVHVRVVDPETGEVLGENSPGLLQVKSPSLMAGYLGMPEKTAAVLQDGWYTTGDIVAVDEDGFLTITDRLARFSKIAGEMVPHTTIEDVLHQALGLSEQALAVAGVPDERRGERLVVLHTLEDEQLDELVGRLDEIDLPNLWRPKAQAFYRIDAIPVLGTGKMDIKRVKALAETLDIAG